MFQRRRNTTAATPCRRRWSTFSWRFATGCIRLNGAIVAPMVRFGTARCVLWRLNMRARPCCSSVWKILPSASVPRPICVFRQPHSSRKRAWSLPMPTSRSSASTPLAVRSPAMRLKRSWARHRGCSVQGATTRRSMSRCGAVSVALAPGKAKSGTDARMARSIHSGRIFRP